MEKGSLDCLNILCTKKKKYLYNFLQEAKMLLLWQHCQIPRLEPLFLILYDLMHFIYIQIWLIVNILSDLYNIYSKSASWILHLTISAA